MMSYWGWLMFGFGILCLEMFIGLGAFLWLGGAAVVTGAVVFFLPDLLWAREFILFAGLSMGGFFFTLVYFRRREIRTDQAYLNRRAEQCIGFTGILTEGITNGYGKIVLFNTQWRVKGSTMPEGCLVSVVSCDGLYLYVEAAGGV